MQLRYLLKRSIRAKLLVAFLLPLLAVVTFVSIYFPLEQRTLSVQSAKTQITTQSEMLAFSAGAGLSEGNFDLVQTAFEWATSDPNVTYIAILDETDEPIIEHNPQELDVDLSSVLAQEDVVIVDGQVQTAAPMVYQEETYGHVVQLYSMETFNAAIRANVLLSVLINLILLGAGIGLIVWFATRLSLQIIALRDASQAVGDGDLNAVIDIQTEDEIGDLAASFTKMVGSIHEANDALQTEKEAVEQKVADAVEESQQQQQYLNQSVDQMLSVIERFADGDLTVDLHTERDDEIAKLFSGFNRAVTNLRNMIEQVNGAVGATVSAANEINSSSELLAASAQEQSAHAGEVAAAVEEMASTIIENARNTTHAAEVAQNSGHIAEEGSQVVRQTVEKIGEIAGVVSESSERVERLGESSQQIGEIVSVINEIADQTNLLALNAAIEAARAGEQGRGFAVVADEVRKLAERTTEATKQIAEMIKGIQVETKEAVEAMQRGSIEVQTGMELADQAGTALDRVVAGTQNTVDMITQVAAASEEQSTTSEEISRSVETISTVSSESAQGVNQIVRSTDSLNHLAEELRSLVSRFKTSNTFQHAADRAPAEKRSLSEGFNNPEEVTSDWV